jgi:hypothetical protein
MILYYLSSYHNHTFVIYLIPNPLCRSIDDRMAYHNEHDHDNDDNDNDNDNDDDK